MTSTKPGYVFERGVKIPKREKIEEGHYEKLCVIGSGAYSNVFLVRHLQSKKIYAMKKQSKRNIIDMKAVDKIMEERRMLSSLHHPFIVRLYCSFQSHHHLFMIFEYANGGDLLGHIENHSDFPDEYGFTESRSRFYAAQIFLALRFLHENNVIFRDLKPDNVLLSKDGNIKLCDLGLSKQIKTKKPNSNVSTKTICGTKEYMAPEMINEWEEVNENELVVVTPYTKSIDWWSYGIVLSFFLFGENPFIEMYYDYVTANKEYIKSSKILAELLEDDPNQMNEATSTKPNDTEDDDDDYYNIEVGVDDSKSQEEEGEGEIDTQLFLKIMLDHDLKIPRYDKTRRKVSPEAIDLVKRLLTKDPRKRIGFNAEDGDGDDEIMKHPFFSKHGYDDEMFKKLEMGMVKPPFIPDVENDQDLRYISDEFKMKDIPADTTDNDDEKGNSVNSSTCNNTILEGKKSSDARMEKDRIRKLLNKGQVSFKGYSFACSSVKE